MAKASLADRLKKKREDLKKGGGDYSFYLIPEGTMRVRVLPFNEDEGDFAFEAITFFLGKDLGTVISPATWGEACPIMEAYEELKGSSDDADKAIAAKIKPKRGYFIPVIKYRDEAGKEVEGEPKLLKAPNSVYGQMIDYFLEPEQGDFTNALEGYDFKIKRTGKGMQDTEYSVLNCKPTKLEKSLRKDYNAEEMLRAIATPYEEAEAKLKQFLNLADDDEDEKPRKGKSNGDLDSSDRPKKKKKKPRA